MSEWLKLMTRVLDFIPASNSKRLSRRGSRCKFRGVCQHDRGQYRGIRWLGYGRGVRGQANGEGAGVVIEAGNALGLELFDGRGYGEQGGEAV